MANDLVQILPDNVNAPARQCPETRPRLESGFLLACYLSSERESNADLNSRNLSESILVELRVDQFLNFLHRTIGIRPFAANA